MRRSQKSTVVLSLGFDPDKYRAWEQASKEALAGKDRSWRIEIIPAFSAEVAVACVHGREDLEIVAVGASSYERRGELLRGIELLAPALSGHKHRPWLFIPDNLRHLRQLLRGVVVQVGKLEDVIIDRWSEQKAA